LEFRKQPARLDRSSLHPAAQVEQGVAMPAYLRVYPRDTNTEQDTQTPSVRVRLGDLFPLLARAQRGNYLWLNDFENDEVLISPDLYELVQAFECYRPSA
jgi:hypothetical protein